MELNAILFCILVLATIVQRLFELRIAARNTRALRRAGGVEFGSEHYVLFPLLHTLFFLSMIAEFFVRGMPLSPLWPHLLLVFVLAQAGRAWVLKTMKGRWSTRVIVLRGEKLIAHGPFRFVAHPNYLIVAVELLVLPLIFELAYTAIVFSIADAFLLLLVRLPVERSALRWSQSLSQN